MVYIFEVIVDVRHVSIIEYVSDIRKAYTNASLIINSSSHLIQN